MVDPARLAGGHAAAVESQTTLPWPKDSVPAAVIADALPASLFRDELCAQEDTVNQQFWRMDTRVSTTINRRARLRIDG